MLDDVDLGGRCGELRKHGQKVDHVRSLHTKFALDQQVTVLEMGNLIIPIGDS